MGHPSGEKQSHDYPEELIAARAELAFKVCLRLIFQTGNFPLNFFFINWLIKAEPISSQVLSFNMKIQKRMTENHKLTWHDKSSFQKLDLDCDGVISEGRVKVRKKIRVETPYHLLFIKTIFFAFLFELDYFIHIKKMLNLLPPSLFSSYF